jgi:hypothetical protein
MRRFLSSFRVRSRHAPLVVIDANVDAAMWTSVSLLNGSQASAPALVPGPTRRAHWTTRMHATPSLTELVTRYAHFLPTAERNIGWLSANRKQLRQVLTRLQ